MRHRKDYSRTGIFVKHRASETIKEMYRIHFSGGDVGADVVRSVGPYRWYSIYTLLSHGNSIEIGCLKPNCTHPWSEHEARI